MLIVLCLAVGMAACSPSAVVTKPRGSLEQGTPYSLPRTVLEFAIQISEEKGKEVDPLPFRTGLTLTPRAVADPRHEYVLQASYSAFAEDDITISTNAAGLLTSVSATSTDKTIDALKSLNETAVNIAKIASTTSGMIPTSANLDRKVLLDITARIVKSMAASLRELKGKHPFLWALPDDPPWSGQAKSLREELAPGLTIVLELTPVTTAADPVVEVDDSPLEGGASGIAVRGVRPYLVRSRVELTRPIVVHLDSIAELDEFRRSSKERFTPWVRDVANQLGLTYLGMEGNSLNLRYDATIARGHNLIHAPDYSPVSMVPFDRALFVKTVSSTSFTEGVLAERRVSRGSSFAAAMEWPLDLSQKLVALPKEILQLKFNIATEAAKSLSAEENLRDSELEAGRRARERREQLLTDQRAEEDSLTDMIRDAEVAHHAYQKALEDGDTPQAITKWADFVKAARKANDLARRLARDAPYDPPDLTDRPPFN